VPRGWRQAWARRGSAIAVLLVAVTPGPAPAEDIVANYSAYWAGLPAANIRLTLGDGGAGYHDEIEITTQGLPHLLSRFRATASAEGRLAADRTAEPSRYLAAYDLRKRHDRRISMRFVRSPGGTIAERGPDDTSRKPPLAEAFRKNSVDPLSALERIREALRTAGPGRRFSIPVYDGARRFDIVGRVLPKADPADAGQVAAPTAGVISGIAVKTNQPVERGAKLLTLEAMKMQSNIYAPISGKISKLLVSPGQNVEAKDLLVTITP